MSRVVLMGSGETAPALLRVRDTARAARDFATADVVRDTLNAAGVEVRDGVDGTHWQLA